MILTNSWSLEDINTNHEEFLKSLVTEVINKAHIFIPIKFYSENIPEINKKLDKFYLDYFKKTIIYKIEKYFLNYGYDYDIKNGLNLLIEEIKQEKISFKNLKSKILYLIEKNEKYKLDDDKENKFSSDMKITIEDL